MGNPFGLLSADPGQLYGNPNLQDPAVQQALANRGLMAAVNSFADSAMPTRVPTPIGAVLGHAFGAAGPAEDAAIKARTDAMQGQLYGAQAAQQQAYLKQWQDPNSQLMRALAILQGGGVPGAAPLMPGAAGAPNQPGALGGTGAGPVAPISDGVTPGGGSREIQTNNFAGMRNPNVPAAGGPNTNPSGWQTFDTPEAGVQAISNQLDRYASGATTGKPLTTIRQIVSTWAPPSENDTNALIGRASQVMGGINPDAPLDLSNPLVKARLVEAMIRNEQGGKLPEVAAGGISKVFGSTAWSPYNTKGPQTAAASPEAARHDLTAPGGLLAMPPNMAGGLGGPAGAPAAPPGQAAALPGPAAAATPPSGVAPMGNLSRIASLLNPVGTAQAAAPSAQAGADPWTGAPLPVAPAGPPPTPAAPPPRLVAPPPATGAPPGLLGPNAGLPSPNIAPPQLAAQASPTAPPAAPATPAAPPGMPAVAPAAPRPLTAPTPPPSPMSPEQMRAAQTLQFIGALSGHPELGQLVTNSPAWAGAKAAAEAPYKPWEGRAGGALGYPGGPMTSIPTAQKFYDPTTQRPYWGYMTPGGGPPQFVQWAEPSETEKTIQKNVGEQTPIQVGPPQAPGAAPGSTPTTDPTPTSRGTLLPPTAMAAPISGTNEELNKRSEDFAETVNKWGESTSGNYQSINRLEAMANALKIYQSGPISPHLSDLRALLDSAGIKAFDSWFQDPAQAQIILKNNIQAAIGSLDQSGLTRQTQGELFALKENMANPSLTPVANQAILAQGLGMLRWQQAMMNDWADAKKAGWRDPQDYERAWAQTNPLDPFVQKELANIGPLRGMPGNTGAATPGGAAPLAGLPPGVPQGSAPSRTLPDGRQVWRLPSGQEIVPKAGR